MCQIDTPYFLASLGPYCFSATKLEAHDILGCHTDCDCMMSALQHVAAMEPDIEPLKYNVALSVGGKWSYTAL
jgi:hypothetical protein